MIGRTLAHYEVVAKLGEGGMGAVYQAKDTKLGRDVALKVLPEQFASDEERLARFHREARTLAALNHPNVAAIHGLEHDGGVHFLVMELVEGEDLAQTLERGALPVDEAVRIARAVATGLEEAHQAGIIHRDLKPANVKVAPDGKVKILDFGLARAFQGESTAEEATLNSPTITAAMTGAGVILGTAAYMSPEQARGTGVDRRTDIWSFGAMFFEMLTGTRLFQGETISDTLAGILKSDPDWSQLPDDTPDIVRLLLIRCLERDRTQRLQDIGEARIMLGRGGETLFYSGQDKSGATAPATASRGGKGALLGFAMAALVVGLLGGVALIRALTPAPAPPPVRYLDVAVTAEGEGGVNFPSISPDGRLAVYVLGDRLWLRRFDTGTTTAVPGTEGAFLPFWSPDSRQIGFFVGSRVKRVAADGGLPVDVCVSDETGNASGGTWSDDGRILFSYGTPNGIWSVPEGGGVPTVAVLPDTTVEQDMHDLLSLPDGRGLVYVSHLKGDTYSAIRHLRDGRLVEVFSGGSRIVVGLGWSPDGRLVFGLQGDNGGVWALPYDPDTQEVLDEPLLVDSNGTAPSIATDGSLMYVRGEVKQLWQLVRRDREGQVLDRYGEPDDTLPFFGVDPEGRRATLSISDDQDASVWLLDLERGTQSRLTFEGVHFPMSAWFPDGDRVLMCGGPERTPQMYKLYTYSLEQGGDPQAQFPGIFASAAPDGRSVVFSRFGDGLELYAATVAQDGSLGEARPLFADEGWQYGARVSPRGDVVAYVSRETGRDEVYLRGYPGAGHKRQVSANGGGWPVWNGTGDRLYYMQDNTVVEVEIGHEGGLSVGRPVELFERPDGDDRFGVGWPLYLQVDAEGESFWVLEQVERGSGREPLVFVGGWGNAGGER